MYLVFCKTLLTDKGKALVRDHQEHSDAQMIYTSLVEYYTTETLGAAQQTRLLEYLTMARLGEGTSWNGTTNAFVLHYLEQFCQYKSVTPDEQHICPALKLILLQNAVSNVPNLHHIKTQALQISF